VSVSVLVQHSGAGVQSLHAPGHVVFVWYRGNDQGSAEPALAAHFLNRAISWFLSSRRCCKASCWVFTMPCAAVPCEDQSVMIHSHASVFQQIWFFISSDGSARKKRFAFSPCVPPFDQTPCGLVHNSPPWLAPAISGLAVHYV